MRRALQFGIPVVLAGYALFDRAFAYAAAAPGTPVFAGELLLLLGTVLAVLATGHFKLALRHSVPIGVILAFAGWGLVRTIPLIPVYGLDAIRDAALWYYALMAVIVRALVIATPELPHRWARAFAPFVVVLLLWSPIAMVLGNLTGPLIPGSSVPMFSHKVGNIAVDTVIAIGFLWLVPVDSLSRRVRRILTALATVVIVASGNLNRGGAVAALIALVVIGVLAGRRRLQLFALMVTTVIVGLVLAWGLDVHIPVPGAEGRDISVSQLWQNVLSVTGASEDNSQLTATVEFRNDLWTGAINLTHEQNALVTGLGFGPNLAQELGVQATPADPLRSPHNSHVDVLARMGLIGGVLWLGLWASWYFVVLTRLRRRPNLSPVNAGLLKVCAVGVTAILANAYFDPTLEGPQVAIWLWTLAGLGVGIASMPVRSTLAATPHGSVVSEKPT